nr:hypothetical protein CFP56_04201 [Quercus suber]
MPLCTLISASESLDRPLHYDANIQVWTYHIDPSRPSQQRDLAKGEAILALGSPVRSGLGGVPSEQFSCPPSDRHVKLSSGVFVSALKVRDAIVKLRLKALSPQEKLLEMFDLVTANGFAAAR